MLGLNYSPEAIGISVYTSGLCEELAIMGHQVRVISGKPYYPHWKIFDGYNGWWRRTVENKVDITRCPIYLTSNPTGIHRIFHHVSFAASALFPTLKAAVDFRPDLVITVAPSLIAAPVAWLAAKLARTPSWLHIQDFEVEAAFATGLINGRGLFAALAQNMERFTIRLFDHLSTISPEMCTKLASFGNEVGRITEFRNWSDVDSIEPLTQPSRYLSEWNIKTPYVALYSGNIANKQGIEIIIDAAMLLKDRGDLTFVICGGGPNRARLEMMARELQNVKFFDLQPKERLADMLGLATVHLLPQKAAAADLVLPSKLSNMLASGRPVIATAASGTGLAREVEGAGVAVSPGDAPAFAAAIGLLLDDANLRHVLSAGARKKAEAVWSKRAIIDGFAAALERVVGKRTNSASAAETEAL